MINPSGSKSTDKLEVLMDGLAKWPAEAFSRIQSATISWEEVNDSTVPNFNVNFYEKV